jgi:cob(I)alamin adenosyltransferase
MLQQTHSHKKYVFPIICLWIIVIALSGWTFVQSSDLHQTQDSLASAQNQLTTTQADLAHTETNLTTAQSNLTQTQIDLTNTQSKLSTAQVKLVQTQADLTNALNQVTLTNERVNTLQTDYDSLKTNYDRLTTGYAYVLSDPTYLQMKNFLSGDKTDQKTYDASIYNCQNFSADLITNAAKLKIRCAFVSIDERSSGHAIIAFNTTDKGIIYIEPQSDEEVNLQVGKRYYQCVIPKTGSYYIPPGYDDTILRFVVIW